MRVLQTPALPLGYVAGEVTSLQMSALSLGGIPRPTGRADHQPMGAAQLAVWPRAKVIVNFCLNAKKIGSAGNGIAARVVSPVYAIQPWTAAVADWARRGPIRVACLRERQCAIIALALSRPVGEMPDATKEDAGWPSRV
jgi:hypothetical protein